MADALPSSREEDFAAQSSCRLANDVRTDRGPNG